ncbi:TPA: DNA topology modulation protein FlaR, partial [Streptococcus pyogenes]|nr:DNA topology modulation protein FlaR [Streptococcus pyogenes]
MKIAIIGHSGSGKSTLARFLGQHYHCEVFHLDQLHFSSNWQERSDHDMIADLSTCLLKQDWIIEGNYANCLYEERMSEADYIIYVNFSRFHCVYRAFKRYLNYRGKTRPDMAD